MRLDPLCVRCVGEDPRLLFRFSVTSLSLHNVVTIMLLGNKVCLKSHIVCSGTVLDAIIQLRKVNLFIELQYKQ